MTLKQVGRELGVRYVLEGSVRKDGNRIRISAQLIDAQSDHHVWAERYDRELQDIFEVQDEVARNVASALTVALYPEEGKRLSRPPTENVDAYDIYLRTRSSLWPPTRENILTARSAYRRIMELDSTFAGGPAGLSLTHSLAIMFNHTEEPEEDARQALELAGKAFELDGEFAQAHSAQGIAYVVDSRYDRAVACARRAVDLQPGDADAYLFLTFCCLFAGEADSAYEAISTALRIDPQYIDGPYLNVLGLVCLCVGRPEESLAALQKNVDRGGSLAPPALAFRIAALDALGRQAEAKETARTLLEFYPAFSISKFRLLHMFKNPDDSNCITEPLRMAGLPA